MNRDSGCAAILAAVGALALPLGAVALDYQYTYEADAMPTNASPAWGVLSDSGSPLAGITDGTLHFETALRTDNLAWYLGRTAGFSDVAGWDHDDAYGSTVDFRVRVIYSPETRDGFMIQLGDHPAFNSDVWTFVIGKTRVAYYDAAIANYRTVDIDNSEFRTFRLALRTNECSLLDVESRAVLFDRVPPNAQAARDAIVFGDFGSGQLGTWELDWIRWTNLEAEFEIPPKGTIITIH